MRKANYVCPLCKVNHTTERINCGDYFETVRGYVCQSVCPICGRMWPLLDGYPTSRGKLKTYATKVAMHFNLDFVECKKLAKDSYGADIDGFAKLFSIQFRIPHKEISLVINSGSDEKA